MHLMKLLPLLAGCSLLGLSSCALSSDKAKEKEEEAETQTSGGAIPPPANLQATNGNGSSSSANQEELPQLPTATEQNQKPNEKINVKEIDDFIFKDVLEDLPSQRDLASPPTSLTPSSIRDEGTQNLTDGTKPLVVNP